MNQQTMLILDFSDYPNTDIFIPSNNIISTLPLWQQHIYHFLNHWKNNQTFSLQTSGSTGIPKEITVKKKQFIQSANITITYFQLKQGDTFLLCLPINFIAGQMMIVRAIVRQSKLICIEPKNISINMIDTSIDFVAMTPMQLHHSLIHFNKWNYIKKLIIGGAKVNNHLIQSIQDLPTAIFETYGMTETLSHIAIKSLNKGNLSDIFHVINGFDIAMDSRGCLIIKAPHIYQQQVITNDLVELINNNQFVWLGRYDNVINSGGIKHIPEIIENKISKYINKPFFIAGIPDKILGEKLMLVIEDKNQHTISLQILISSVLSKKEMPKEIIFIPKFIYTSSGKINKSKTLELFSY